MSSWTRCLERMIVWSQFPRKYYKIYCTLWTEIELNGFWITEIDILRRVYHLPSINTITNVATLRIGRIIPDNGARLPRQQETSHSFPRRRCEPSRVCSSKRWYKLIFFMLCRRADINLHAKSGLLVVCPTEYLMECVDNLPGRSNDLNRCMSSGNWRTTDYTYRRTIAGWFDRVSVICTRSTTGASAIFHFPSKVPSVKVLLSGFRFKLW